MGPDRGPLARPRHERGRDAVHRRELAALLRRRRAGRGPRTVRAVGAATPVVCRRPMDVEEHWQAWRTSLGEDGLISYRYLGCSSTALTRDTAEGRMQLRRDLRTPGGLLAAPLGIALLDTAGINVDAIGRCAPTQIDVTVFDAARDVEAVRFFGEIVREGRSQMFTVADRRRGAPRACDRLRLHELGGAGADPARFRLRRPRARRRRCTRSPAPHRRVRVVPRSGGSYVLDGLSARVGADSLHQGPIQVMLEAAALDVARRRRDGCDLCRAHRCDARAARQDRPLRRDRARAGRQRADHRLPRGAARRRRRRAYRRDRLLALPPRLTAVRGTSLERARGGGYPGEQRAGPERPGAERRERAQPGRTCPSRTDGSRSTTCDRCARSCHRRGSTGSTTSPNHGPRRRWCRSWTSTAKRPSCSRSGPRPCCTTAATGCSPVDGSIPRPTPPRVTPRDREADEELGIPAGRVDIVGQLDTHGPIVTGFVIEVFVGVIDGPAQLVPDPREVRRW